MISIDDDDQYVESRFVESRFDKPDTPLQEPVDADEFMNGPQATGGAKRRKKKAVRKTSRKVSRKKVKSRRRSRR
jgi:hypothetical protein